MSSSDVKKNLTNQGKPVIGNLLVYMLVSHLTEENIQQKKVFSEKKITRINSWNTETRVTLSNHNFTTTVVNILCDTVMFICK